MTAEKTASSLTLFPLWFSEQIIDLELFRYNFIILTRPMCSNNCLYKATMSVSVHLYELDLQSAQTTAFRELANITDAHFNKEL